MPEPPTGLWKDGPYPNRWRTGTKKPLSGSREGRASYINPGLDELLYNSRWFRVPTNPHCDVVSAFEIKAFELFRLPTEAPRPSGILIVHGRITDTSQPFRVLDTVVNHNEQHGRVMRTWLQGILPPKVFVHSSHRRAEHITLMTYRSFRMPTLPGLRGANAAQMPNAWLAYIASSGRIVPDIEKIDSAGTVIGMSVSLRGLVSRSGIALVGLRRDSGRSDGSRGFDYGGAEFFVEGLYSDTMLLAQLQKYKVRELRERLNAARRAGGRPDQLASLEQEVIAFRATYWRSDFAPQGSQDDFLQAYQETNGVAVELGEVHDQIREYSDQVQRRQQELTNAVLGVLTVLAFPLGIATAVWAGIANRTFGELGITSGIGLILAAVIVIIFPGARSMLRGVLPHRRG